MKRIQLNHLYNGQILNASFMWLAEYDPNNWPIDHGYEFYHRGKCLGEAKVIERRSILVGDITKSLSHMVIGMSHTGLMLDLTKRLGQIHDDTRVYVLCFHFVHLYEEFFRAQAEQRELLLAKKTPLTYQAKF